LRHIQVGKRVNPRNASSAGDVLLATAVIAGIQWLVIHHLASNTTLVWIPLGVSALLAGYTLADALTGSIGLGASFRNRRGGGRR
jgi:hypothetical protein